MQATMLMQAIMQTTMLVQLMMQVTMLVQPMMQMMGDGSVCDKLSLLMHPFYEKIQDYNINSINFSDLSH
jgi:hypothetical protein